MVSSSICGSWAAHRGWMLATAPSSREPRDVVGVHDLEVGEVVAAVGRAVGGARRLDGVERLADGPVAEGVEVDLEAGRVELGHVIAQGDRVDEAQARVVTWRSRRGRGRARASRP